MQAFPAETRTARMPDGLVAALRPLDARAPWIDAWRALSRDSLVENLFFEPDFAFAAGAAFGAGVALLVVSDRPPEEPGARLLALWPCRIVHRWGVPLPALMGWTHGFSIFGVPLLDRADPARALCALLDAPRHLRLPRRLLMPYLPLDGPFAALIERTLADRAARRVDYWRHGRGFLDLAARDPEARARYLETQLSHRKTSQLARLWRRLGASQPVLFETMRDPLAITEALDDYVALERSGWKGRSGTAIEQRPGEIAFLRRLVQTYAARGQARIDRLRRDGRTLAASIGFETGSTFWYLKIAYAEDEAKNSPGAHLIRRVTEAVLADPRLAACDSCAPPDFALIDTFWAERRRLAHGLIEAGGGDKLFPLAAQLERARAYAVGLRRRAKRPR